MHVAEVPRRGVVGRAALDPRPQQGGGVPIQQGVSSVTKGGGGVSILGAGGKSYTSAHASRRDYMHTHIHVEILTCVWQSAAQGM